MSLEFKKYSDLEVLDTMPEDANAIVQTAEGLKCAPVDSGITAEEVAQMIEDAMKSAGGNYAYIYSETDEIDVNEIISAIMARKELIIELTDHSNYFERCTWSLLLPDGYDMYELCVRGNEIYLCYEITAEQGEAIKNVYKN